MEGKVKTQIARAQVGEITQEMMIVAAAERLNPEYLRDEVAVGRVVIPANVNHKNLKPMGIGRQLKTKINANIGTSSLSSCPQAEVVKLKAAIEFGADTVMDLSTGDNLDFTRRTIIDASPVPIGTVPIYELACGEGDGVDLSEDAILAVIRRQAEQGVDYMTVHAGLRPDQLPAARARKLRIVSRGGALIARHMSENKCDNPFYSCFDRILDICREFDVTLSLGDGMRPGCLADASDPAQLAELRELGILAARCRAAGVQVMIEGPGHIPLDQVGFNMEIERVWCGDAPFYVLGPVVIDCSPGYDHISSAIGAAVAAMHGAAMLCYVTPKEHLGLPNARDVRDGVIAYKIAAHAGDIAKGVPGARERDDAISDARAAFDWEAQFNLALDPAKARELRDEALNERSRTGESGASASGDHFCTMCGPKLCSMRVSKDI
ncbi:MAG: phosphomethylpyrimidine synthase ThiC [Victivallaceae bacterium]|nr:phosphomethylpyrimidine synthase ThiC [Victivallaceae bacterium]